MNANRLAFAFVPLIAGLARTQQYQYPNVWLPLGSNGLYHSTDGGVTWAISPMSPMLILSPSEPPRHEPSGRQSSFMAKPRL
jgi:hypothetical protein